MIASIPHTSGDEIFVILGDPTEAELEAISEFAETIELAVFHDFGDFAVLVATPKPTNPNAPKPWDVPLDFEAVVS